MAFENFVEMAAIFFCVEASLPQLSLNHFYKSEAADTVMKHNFRPLSRQRLLGVTFYFLG